MESMTGAEIENIKTLADARLGVAVRIVSVMLEGALRERLHNHGFIEHNLVVPLLKAPFGGVRIYRVMNTSVAMRREVAARITVREEE